MKKLIRILFFLVIIFLLVAGWFAYILFGRSFSNKTETELRIRSGWSIEKLADELQKNAGLTQKDRFIKWVPRFGYLNVRPCTIKIPKHCSLYEIAEILKKNRYQTTNVTILGSMDKEAIGFVLSEKLEINADSFVHLVSQQHEIMNTGYNDTTWPALILPNTYNFAVAADLNAFIKRMVKEHDRFWNEERRAKAELQGLTPLQVSILASIVTKESNKTDEYENIAGVYLNRLRKGMLLQADPTVVFARKTTGRVLSADLKIESVYNTYRHKGLPPGPLCIPNLSSIEAVLNYSGHDYLYFVALPDASGYHHFSPNLAEHLLWAAKYHRAMNARRKNGT